MTEKTIPAKAEAQNVTTTREDERFLKPPVDIYEKADGLVVICDMPGVDRDGIDIKIDNSVLTIQGKVAHAHDADAIYSEFGLMNFFRQFELSEEVDQEKISADLKNGVLTLTLPKVEKAKPKQITVKVG